MVEQIQHDLLKDDKKFLRQSIYEMEVFVLPNELKPPSEGRVIELVDSAVQELISESAESWHLDPANSGDLTTQEVAGEVQTDKARRGRHTITQSIYDIQPFSLHRQNDSNQANQFTAELPAVEPNLERTAESPPIVSKMGGESYPPAVTLELATGRPDSHIDRVIGRYRIVDVIGRGNMAVVYKGCHVDTGEIVALKTYKVDAEATHKLRFAREIDTHSRLDHKNVVRYIDAVKSADGQQYLVIENVRGLSLQVVLDMHGPIQNPLNIWSIFSQVCEALDHAHSRGIIHRDLKPGNVILSKRESEEIEVKLVDFGIAHDETDLARLTQEGSSIGSPLYMSPEQCQGFELTPCSDVYSLGILITETVTGFCPYRGKSIMSIIRSHCNPMTKPEPLSQLCPELPNVARLEQILVKALETEPEERYQSASELKDALSLWFGEITAEWFVSTSSELPATRPQVWSIDQERTIPPYGAAGGARRIELGALPVGPRGSQAGTARGAGLSTLWPSHLPAMKNDAEHTSSGGSGTNAAPAQFDWAAGTGFEKQPVKTAPFSDQISESSGQPSAPGLTPRAGADLIAPRPSKIKVWIIALVILLIVSNVLTAYIVCNWSKIAQPLQPRDSVHENANKENESYDAR